MNRHFISISKQTQVVALLMWAVVSTTFYSCGVIDLGDDDDDDTEEVTQGDCQLAEGETYQLRKSDGSTFSNATYQSSDEWVASVDANGLVTAHLSGEAIVTVSYSDTRSSASRAGNEVQFRIIVPTRSAFPMAVEPYVQMGATPSEVEDYMKGHYNHSETENVDGDESASGSPLKMVAYSMNANETLALIYFFQDGKLVGTTASYYEEAFNEDGNKTKAMKEYESAFKSWAACHFIYHGANVGENYSESFYYKGYSVSSPVRQAVVSYELDEEKDEEGSSSLFTYSAELSVLSPAMFNESDNSKAKQVTAKLIQTFKNK